MKFNIRVYGILVFDNKIFLTNENRFGKEFTKFPGGGLEFGEGTKECLKREFKEEFSLDIKVKKLLYLNDFYQQSAFSNNDQIISIYYIVNPVNEDFKPSEIKPNNATESPKWKDINELSVKDLTFPIDKHLVDQVLPSYFKHL